MLFSCCDLRFRCANPVEWHSLTIIAQETNNNYIPDDTILAKTHIFIGFIHFFLFQTTQVRRYQIYVRVVATKPTKHRITNARLTKD